jgi:hypothetical protein
VEAVMKSFRSILTFIAWLLLAAIGLAKEAPVYPLTAKIVSMESSVNTSFHPVSNLSTGVVTGSVMSSAVESRIEVLIGDTTYIASNLHSRFSLELGKTYQAQIGKSHGLDVMWLVGTDKKGKSVVSVLEITGKKL